MYAAESRLGKPVWHQSLPLLLGLSLFASKQKAREKKKTTNSLKGPNFGVKFFLLYLHGKCGSTLKVKSLLSKYMVVAILQKLTILTILISSPFTMTSSLFLRYCINILYHMSILENLCLEPVQSVMLLCG